VSDGVDLPANAPWWAVLLASSPWLYRVGRWLLGHADRREQRRQDRLDAEEEDLGKSWSAYRKRIEARLQVVERQNYGFRLAFEHVAGALIRIDPHNPALAIAGKLLEQAIPIELAREMAGENGDLIDQLRGTA